MTDPTLAGLSDCGCCGDDATPPAVDNRPGLSAVAYRVGTHAVFLERMLAALSDARFPALAGLRTRDRDDFAVALCDAWAVVADVLSFYQERLANEAFLRTATDRLSLVHLARLIGYELAPGVAADAVLAFTLEDAPGSPTRTLVDVGAKVQSVPGPGETAQTYETVEPLEARAQWNAVRPVRTLLLTFDGATELYLDGLGTQLQVGDALLVVAAPRLTDTGSEAWDFRLLDAVDAFPDRNATRVRWQKPLGGHGAAPQGVTVYALRQRAALFGHNAPDPRVLGTVDESLTEISVLTGDLIWTGFDLNAAAVDLDLAYPKVVRDGWAVLATAGEVEVIRVSAVSFPSRSDFTLSGKVTRIVPDNLEHAAAFGLRSTIVYAQSEELTPVAPPDLSPVAGGSVVLDSPLADVAVGRKLMVVETDPRTQAATRELAEVAKLEPVAGGTRVTFAAPLTREYARDRVTFNANTVAATHGESVTEILGGGTAGRPFQRFALRQDPLTYTSAATPRGTSSTLRVRVNDLLWHEVPTFDAAGPRDRVFVTRTDGAGKTNVIFGDGTAGAIPAGGQDNVRAEYRKGIGKGGRVKAGQLSLLLTRPLGVREVVNPADATGGKDAEVLADARRNAPLTVRTLDRVVSLHDYEDFARAFAGVGKALATWTWHGREKGVFLTVAGDDGAAFASGNLVASLKKAGDPFVLVAVAAYRPAFFTLAGKLKVDPDRLRDKVVAAVEAALRDAFSFAARDFGQPVAASEVVAVIQQVPGVIAVDLDALHRVGGPAGLSARLLADREAFAAGGEPLAAELLLLDPGPLPPFGVLP